MILEIPNIFLFSFRMVRKYIKKKNRPEIPKQVLKEAIKNVLAHTMTIRTAANTFNIPKSTLQDHCKRAKKRNNNVHDSGNESTSSTEERNVSKYASRQIFSTTEEAELEKYMKNSSKILYGLTYRTARSLAFEYASKLEKKVPKSWEVNRSAGIEWMRSFLKRHPTLSYRKAENTSFARAAAFNKENVEEFFKNYDQVQTQYKFSPHHIWNIDETGVSTVMQAPRVIAEKAKSVGQCVSAERGTLITMCGIISASGNSIPPLYIFPRVRMKEQFLFGAVPGAVGYAEKSGWMTSKIFVNLLQHIQKHTNSSSSNRILIIMDNHETHVSIEAISYARENGMVLLSFPPHCTHHMQPLDKGVFGPFKARCKVTYNDFILSHPGRPINIYDIAKLTAEPYVQSFTPKNIINSFKSTGLWPINRLIYSDDDFLGAYATDRPISEQNIVISDDAVSAGNISSTLIAETSTPLSKLSTSAADKSSHKAATEETDTELMVKTLLSEVIEKATQSKIKILQVIKLTDIRPYPKAEPRKANKKCRKGKSRIYTSTPEKNRIEELEQERRSKLQKTNTKRKIGDEKNENVKLHATTQKRKRIIKRIKNESTSSDSDIELPHNIRKAQKCKPYHVSSDSDINMESEKEEIDQLLDDEKIIINDFVLVKFATRKRVLHYVGQVQEYDNEEYVVKFLRKSSRGFHFPIIDDISSISREDIVSKLPQPKKRSGTSRTCCYFDFNINFFGYNIQ